LSPHPPARVPARLSAPLVFGLTMAIILDTAAQTLWKRAASGLPATPPGLLASAGALLVAVLHQPLFLIVGALMAAQMYNWLRTLDHADVSFALPITALSYISVAIVSATWLSEPLTPGRIGGMALILAGVFLVARTEPNTIAPDGDRPS